MEVVVTTGAVRRAKLQSNRRHQQTNIQLFYRPDALPVTQPTVSKVLKGKLKQYLFHKRLPTFPHFAFKSLCMPIPVSLKKLSHPRPLCSLVMPDVRDRQTDVIQTDRRQTKASLNAPAY